MKHIGHITRARIIAFGVALVTSWAVLSVPAGAQITQFEPGWDLDTSRSNIKFQSIKNTAKGLKVESSSFAAFTGSIEPDGAATVKVLLDSVDTLVDLRNVRMRFLFFETFRYPEATISLKLTPDMVAELAASHRANLTVPYVVDLHGVEFPMESPITVTLLNENLVSVASAVPISLAVADFGLAENIPKLEQAVGGITLVPTATVTFDLIFGRRGSDEAPSPVQETPGVAPVVTSVALEPEGDFGTDACVGRFEVLSKTGNIYFRTASARLQDESFPLLASVVDIVRRCPDLKVVISGHTDSDGNDQTNRVLSEARAQSVVGYLVQEGINGTQLRAVGYGEQQPVAPNDTAHNKGLNRRIEFAVETGG